MDNFSLVMERASGVQLLHHILEAQRVSRQILCYCSEKSILQRSGARERPGGFQWKHEILQLKPQCQVHD